MRLAALAAKGRPVQIQQPALGRTPVDIRGLLVASADFYDLAGLIQQHPHGERREAASSGDLEQLAGEGAVFEQPLDPFRPRQRRGGEFE